MLAHIQQLAVLDALLGNWALIHTKMGSMTLSLEEALAKVAARLSSSADPDEIASAVDDLLDLVQDTAAAAYVGELIVRAGLGLQFTARTRGVLAETPVDREEAAAVAGNTLQTGQDFGRAVATQTESGHVPLFFATNRNCIDPETANFGSDMEEDISYGLAKVTIPVDVHRLGHVEQPHWWQPFTKKDDSRRFVVLGGSSPMTPEQFTAALGKEAGGNDLLVFLHGYNVTFEEAALRAAQLAYDMCFAGRVVLFSWPSQGSLSGYLADEERAAVSAARLHALLQLIAEGPWRKVHLMAHSMGNRVLLSGLSDHPWPNRKLSQIVFVAADVYVEIFRQKFSQIRPHGDGYTSYASKNDRALWFSSLLHQAERVGITRGDPFVTDGLETIEAGSADTSLLGMRHSYFGDKRSVLTDIGYLLREGLSAARRGIPWKPEQRYWYFPQ